MRGRCMHDRSFSGQGKLPHNDTVFSHSFLKAQATGSWYLHLSLQLNFPSLFSKIELNLSVCLTHPHFFRHCYFLIQSLISLLWCDFLFTFMSNCISYVLFCFFYSYAKVLLYNFCLFPEEWLNDPEKRLSTRQMRSRWLWRSGLCKRDRCRCDEIEGWWEGHGKGASAWIVLSSHLCLITT